MAMNGMGKARHMRVTLTNLRSASLLGMILSAVTLAGCGDGSTTTVTPTQKPSAPAVAEPSPAGGKSGKPKVDSTSRRQHQKELAGQVPASN
jgi:hypothetical protein